MEKRGQLTTNQIITLIIAILGFVVVLLFILSPDLIGQSEEEVCRLSILQRASLPRDAPSIAPLKCTAKKICLSLGDDCPQFVGEKDVQKLTLPKNTEGAAKTIEKITAESMYDCWAITGKGRLPLFTGGENDPFTNFLASTLAVRDAKAKCLICARIALSPNLQKDTKILGNVSVNRYLKEEKVPGSSLTFLQSFTDKQVGSYPSNLSDDFSNVPNKLGADQIAIIFSQMITGDTEAIDEAVRAGTNTGIAIGGSLLTPAGRVVKIIGVKAVVGLAAIAMITTGTMAYFKTQENQALTAAYCGKFASENDLTGCSMVSSVNYNDIDTINKLCAQGIEGKVTSQKTGGPILANS